MQHAHREEGRTGVNVTSPGKVRQQQLRRTRSFSSSRAFACPLPIDKNQGHTDGDTTAVEKSVAGKLEDGYGGAKPGAMGQIAEGLKSPAWSTFGDLSGVRAQARDERAYSLGGRRRIRRWNDPNEDDTL